MIPTDAAKLEQLRPFSLKSLFFASHSIGSRSRFNFEPISVKNWSSSAATSPGRPSPTNGSSVIAPAKSCCKLKSPYKDGTTHIVMEPLEVMERPAAQTGLRHRHRTL